MKFLHQAYTLILIISAKASVSTDESNKISISCLTNFTCIEEIVKYVTKEIRSNPVIEIGPLKVKKVKNNSIKMSEGSEDFISFLKGKSISIDFGSLAIGVEMAKDYDNFLDVSLFTHLGKLKHILNIVFIYIHGNTHYYRK